MDKAHFKHFTYFCLSALSISVIVSTDFIQLCKPDKFVGLRWLCAKKRKPHISVVYSGSLKEVRPPSQKVDVYYRYDNFYCAEPKLKKLLE